MDIVTPADFHSVIKGFTLLLDTNVFVDALIHPKQFGDFFNILKANGVIIAAIEPVAMEFVKGSTDKTKLEIKKSILKNIVDSYLPITKEVFDNTNKLIEKYMKEGAAFSITDFLLGGTLMKMKGWNIYLITKDLNGFPTDVFTLKTYFHLFHRKAIHSYVVLGYE